MRLLLPCLLSLFAAALPACLWDYDTLAQESRGKADLKAVIVGGFPRNPPLYYEMRLERVTKLLETSPDDLDAYDAAGVACDRLGRADEAIEWMTRKQAAMERMGYDASKHEQPNHRYRYLANLGTFYAHRWFKNGANREAMDDLKQGRELIAQAIKENPNAHFGREKYQLMVMDWVIGLDPEKLGATSDFERTPLGNFDGFFIEDFEREDVDEALAGFSGLILQGNAWESVDVLNTIRALLAHRNDRSFAYFAELRVRELAIDGKRSITWQGKIDIEAALEYQSVQGVTTESGTTAEYKRLREVATEWHERRTAYMLDNLSQGRHPDTHPEFWSDFDGDPEMPEGMEPSWVRLSIDWFIRFFSRGGALAVAVVLLLLAIAAALIKALRMYTASKNKPLGPPRKKKA